MGSFDFAPLLAPGLPPPAAQWKGLAKYSFVGGNNDPDHVPVEALIKAMSDVLAREGRDLATYGLASGPQGYRPLREFLVRKLKRSAGIVCAADDILITSGSLQALDLVNSIFLTRGRYRDHRAGMLSRLDQPAGQARRQCHRHPARPRRHAHGCACRGACRSQAPRRAAEIHLHHPDRAESDRHDFNWGAPARIAPACRRTWRADLRRRLLCRSDLGRQAAARSTP